MEVGFISKETTVGTSTIETSRMNFCQEIQDYVAGGVTFNYPAGMFSSAPNVRLAIELKNLTYSTGQIISPIITANTTTSTTVRVNVGTTASMSEALTDDITIYIFASM